MSKNGNVAELPRITDPIEAMLRFYRGLRTLWDYLDEGQREVERFNSGRPICVQGCGLCCQRAAPVVSKLEAAYMVGRLQHLSSQIREASLSWVKAAGSGPCPFLMEDKGCLVHDSRPLSCRSYGVTSAPEEWCPRPLTGSETPNGRMLVGRHTPLGQKIEGSMAGLWRFMWAFERHDLTEIGPLPIMVAEIVAPADVKRLRAENAIDAKKMQRARGVMPNLFRGQS